MIEDGAHFLAEKSVFSMFLVKKRLYYQNKGLKSIEHNLFSHGMSFKIDIVKATDNLIQFIEIESVATVFGVWIEVPNPRTEDLPLLESGEHVLDDNSIRIDQMVVISIGHFLRVIANDVSERKWPGRIDTLFVLLSVEPKSAVAYNAKVGVEPIIT